MRTQNLFALLSDDADDISFLNTAPTAHKEKKKPLNHSSADSDLRANGFNHPRFVNRRDDKSKAEVEGQFPQDSNKKNYQDHNVRSNGYQPQNRNGFFQGKNIVADGYQSNGKGSNGNYKGNSYQKNYNGVDVVRAGGNFGRGRGYNAKGRDNGEKRAYNKNSNGNVKGIQSNPLPKSEALNENDNLGLTVDDENEGWKVVSRRRQDSCVNSMASEARSEVSFNSEVQVVSRRRQDSRANSMASEARSEVSLNSDVQENRNQGNGFGRRGNGQIRRRGNDSYNREHNGHSHDLEITTSVASTHSDTKDDIPVDAQPCTGIETSACANPTGVETSAEEEERKKKKEMWGKEREEERKKKTLKEYEEELNKTKKVVPKEVRIFVADKELEAMQPLGRKKDSLALIGKEESESVSLNNKNKGKKKETPSQKEDVCKTIVQLFLKPTSFKHRQGRYSDRNEGNASEGPFDKGSNSETSYRKRNSGEGFSENGNNFEGLADEEGSSSKVKGAEGSIVLKNDGQKALNSRVVLEVDCYDHQYPALK